MASLWPKGGNKANWRNIGTKNFFFAKNILCHSFRVIVIPSQFLSFLPDFCHSFRISVIPSKYYHFFWIIKRITNTNNTLYQCVLPNIMSCKCPSEHHEMCPSEHNTWKVSFQTQYSKSVLPNTILEKCPSQHNGIV